MNAHIPATAFLVSFRSRSHSAKDRTTYTTCSSFRAHAATARWSADNFADFGRRFASTSKSAPPSAKITKSGSPGVLKVLYAIEL
jgi:hypothetical protein